MGIARRKAGTVVSCPKCHGQVVVPHPAPMEEPEPSPREPAPEALFEGSDFDQVFGTSPGAEAAPQERSPAVLAPEPEPIAPAVSAPQPGPSSAPQQEINFDVERLDAAAAAASFGPGPGRPGLWLPPTAVTLLGLLTLVLLALAFVGGLLVGRSLGG
jgi:hypothetical protein